MNSIRPSRVRGKDGSWRNRLLLTATGYLSNSIFLTAWNSPPACKR